MSMLASDSSLLPAHHPDLPLDHGGCALACTDQLDEALLTPLLEALRAEPCMHTWHPMLAARPRHQVFATFSQIVAHGRPGRVFTYYRVAQHGPEAVAVGVVSDKIATDFAYEGLPVLGRAFVRAELRGQRLYSLILQHRLAYCRARWGAGLAAVHLGTSSWPIERCFGRHHEGKVLYLGDETLRGQGKVRALLGVTPLFEQRLLRGASALSRDGQALVRQFLHEGAGTHRVRDLAPALGRLSETDEGWAMLQAFLHHIPTLQ